MNLKHAPHPSVPESEKVRHRFLIGAAMAFGAVLIHVGNVGAEYVKEAQSFWLKVAPKTGVDLGIGFIVAAFVSIIYDVAVHRTSFLQPVEKLSKDVEEKTDVLIGTVGEFNVILKSAYEMNVHAIYQRQSDADMSAWGLKVENAVSEAKEFVYIAGRTLEELFPPVEDGRRQHISETIRSKLQNNDIKRVRFVLADAYDRESLFRHECRKRSKIERLMSATALFHPARFTAQKVLGIIRELGIRDSEDDEKKDDEKQGRGQLRLRISRVPLPYALVMTENILIIQHYLPYTNGRHGVVIEIRKGGTNTSNLYNLYRSSYEELFRDSFKCEERLVKYVERKPESQEDTKEERLYLEYLNADAAVPAAD